MKQLIYISVFCFAQTFFAMEALWVEEDAITVGQFTTAIHQRYYYIARLTAVHSLIEDLQCSCTITNQDFQTLTFLEPQHSRVKSCIEAMQNTQSCDPLLSLWQEITAYKYLFDKDCIKEYSSLVCVVAYQLSVAMQEQLSSEDKKMISLLLNRAPHEKTDLSSATVTYRFYLIKRLKKVTALLAVCQELSLDYMLTTYLPLCTHIKVTNCAQEIEETGSLQPLLALIEECEQFQEIDDLAYIYELLQLILVVEQHALAPYFLPRRTELCAHYEHDLAGLSIEELLTSIDILTSHIEPYATDTQRVGSFPSLGTLTAMACSTIGLWYTLNQL